MPFSAKPAQQSPSAKLPQSEAAKAWIPTNTHDFDDSTSTTLYPVCYHTERHCQMEMASRKIEAWLAQCGIPLRDVLREYWKVSRAVGCSLHPGYQGSRSSLSVDLDCRSKGWRTLFSMMISQEWLRCSLDKGFGGDRSGWSRTSML